MSENDLGTRKTLFVLVIIVGCFAVLWPKVFYPMMVGPVNQHIKPSTNDKGCCDVISDIDVHTIEIMSELCSNIVQSSDVKPLRGQDVISKCRSEVLNKCGIDLSAVLQEQVRLGRSFKQIVDEVRSFNGSLCLKYNFGLSPSRLGVHHRITLNLASAYIKQERPAHLRPEMLHPALREKGRAIPQPYHPPNKVPGPGAKFVNGRPGPVPGVRPPMGGAGHMAPPQKGLNSMGIIMPIYTVGIVIFFSYTLMKLIFKKRPDEPNGHIYPPVEPSLSFRRNVFEADKSRTTNDSASRDQEMDQLRRRLRETELAMERIVSQMAQVPLRSQKSEVSNGMLFANGSAKKSHEHDQPSVKVLGMEMTASCEGGKKWKRPESPIIPNTPPPTVVIEPAQEIYLEGALPPQSQLLVADSVTEAEVDEDSSSADPTVILASKMTLSVISLDSQEEDGADELKSKDEEILDESKYTTASCTTAAEHDISEDEETGSEEEVEEVEVDEIEEDEIEEVEEDEIEEVEVDEIEEVEVNDIKEEVDEIEKDDQVQPLTRFENSKESEDVLSKQILSDISKEIDTIINAGAQMSGLIAEKQNNNENRTNVDSTSSDED